MSKVKNKHLIFKTSITRIKTCLLVDNKNKTKLIDKSFVCVNKTPSFKLKEPIKFLFCMVWKINIQEISIDSICQHKQL